MKFTDRAIKALKPKEKAYVVTADSESRGVGRLQLKIYPSGTKKFQYQFFFEGKKRMEIGTYDSMSLSNARKKMSALSELLQDGLNPKEERQQKAVEVETFNQKRTLKQLVKDFLLSIEGQWAESSVRNATSGFKTDLLPFINDDLYPDQFTPCLARDIIYNVYNRGAKVKAGTFKSFLRSLFKFAIDFDNSPEQFKKPNLYSVVTNPINDINLEIPFKAGQRWLSESELKSLWHSEQLPKMIHLYFKLCILFAGQRVLELYHSKVNEYDFNENIFTIPIERIKITKKGEHLLPISKYAKPLIEELMLIRGKSDHIWPHRSDNNKPAEITSIQRAFRRYCKDNKIPPFTPRDLRRTCKTLMAKSGMSKQYRDLLQQHTKSDVASIHYDRYDYLKEKREAIDHWTSYLNRILKL
ncbi:MAG: integrase arm-type DNA-binding domain-containing protein [Colwellia sp.]|nr:integrase arm-type DNA-binding domain-containing protein [Colwellia sp.]